MSHRFKDFFQPFRSFLDFPFLDQDMTEIWISVPPRSPSELALYGIVVLNLLTTVK